MANRGRPNTLVKKTLRNALENKDAGTRFLNLKLVAKGYFTIEPVKSGKRGRPAFSYNLTGKGRGFLALSKNWGHIENTLVEDINEPDEVSDAVDEHVEDQAKYGLMSFNSNPGAFSPA